MFSLFIFDKYLFINFLQKSLKNIFPFIKYRYKDVFRYFGKREVWCKYLHRYKLETKQ